MCTIFIRIDQLQKNETMSIVASNYLVCVLFVLSLEDSPLRGHHNRTLFELHCDGEKKDGFD